MYRSDLVGIYSLGPEASFCQGVTATKVVVKFGFAKKLALCCYLERVTTPIQRWVSGFAGRRAASPCVDVQFCWDVWCVAGQDGRVDLARASCGVR